MSKPNKEGKKQEYKTVRIYPKDYVRLRRLSFSQDKPIVRLISEAIELLEKKYGKNYDTYDLNED
ncbi:hypothetical protein [Virgibacillus proomii]|uniref:hypothetical protein n=1 Tax=Virgibacillus proomii TaxID=84407 RepID=UPI000985C225|nr:hypothetical protein [Virgibacillus proomii]